MRKNQIDNITFRVTTDLKSRLTEFCLENVLHNSAVLRQALAKFLKEQMEVELPRLILNRPAVGAHHR
jgi:predicted transcriptional regulator